MPLRFSFPHHHKGLDGTHSYRDTKLMPLPALWLCVFPGLLSSPDHSTLSCILGCVLACWLYLTALLCLEFSCVSRCWLNLTALPWHVFCVSGLADSTWHLYPALCSCVSGFAELLFWLSFSLRCSVCCCVLVNVSKDYLVMVMCCECGNYGMGTWSDSFVGFWKCWLW